MDSNRKIETARKQFANSLVGFWSSANGTFGGVVSEIWEFHPNGTGRWLETGPFGHLRSETLFEWRQHQSHVVEFRFTGIVPHDPQYDYPLEAEEAWESHSYDFIAVQSDVGIHIALKGLSMFGALEYRGPS